MLHLSISYMFYLFMLHHVFRHIIFLYLVLSCITGPDSSFHVLSYVYRLLSSLPVLCFFLPCLVVFCHVLSYRILSSIFLLSYLFMLFSHIVSYFASYHHILLCHVSHIFLSCYIWSLSIIWSRIFTGLFGLSCLVMSCCVLLVMWSRRLSYCVTLSHMLCVCDVVHHNFMLSYFILCCFVSRLSQNCTEQHSQVSSNVYWTLD